MKKIVYIIIVFTLYGCNQLDSKKPVYLNIQASGEVEVIPDIASITINVSCTNKDLYKSNDCTKKSITELFELFNKHKILKKDYHSSRINLEKEYIWKKNSQVFHGYTSSSTINVLFKDLESMSKVLTRTMLMKNIGVSNLSYSHSRIDKLANDAYLKALNNSQILASEIKNKIKGQSIEILEISNIDGKFSQHAENKEYLAKRARSNNFAEDSIIKINPGSLKLTKDIYVLYSLKF